MIVQETFLKRLRSIFDLNIYEVKVWTALLSKGVATAGELADISGVPRSRSYDVLESLEKRGFVIMKLGKPIKYLAVKPEDIVSRVKTNLQDKATEQMKALEKVRSTQLFDEVQLLYKQGIEHVEATDLSGVIKGRKSIINHLKTLLNNAEKSVTIVTTEKGLIRKTEALRSAIKKAKDRGVKIKFASPNTDNLSNDLKKYAEFRKLTAENARFAIADGKDIMFMVSHDDDIHEAYDLGVWVNSPFFAKAVESMFELSWKDLEKA